MSRSLCSTLAWVSITPLGVPVEPEVYWRKASVSPEMSGLRQDWAASAGVASVAIHFSTAISGASSWSAPDSSRMVEVVRTKPASQSRAIARRRGRVRSSRIGSGG